MKTLEIQVPDGHEIDQDNSTFERIVFKEIKKVLTYVDIAKKLFNNNYFCRIGKFTSMLNLSIDSFAAERCNIEIDINDPSNSTTREQLESILALNKLCNVAKYLNDGWLPELRKINQHNWYLTIDKDILKIDYHLCKNEGNVFFKSAELAQKAIEILGEEEIRKALTLNF